MLQPERNATLMIDVLGSYVAAGKFRLHDFVVMPNHLHLLITVREGMTIEKAMPFIKGERKAALVAVDRQAEACLFRSDCSG